MDNNDAQIQKEVHFLDYAFDEPSRYVVRVCQRSGGDWAALVPAVPEELDADSARSIGNMILAASIEADRLNGCMDNEPLISPPIILDSEPLISPPTL